MVNDIYNFLEYVIQYRSHQTLRICQQATGFVFARAACGWAGGKSSTYTGLQYETQNMPPQR